MKNVLHVRFIKAVLLNTLNKNPCNFWLPVLRLILCDVLENWVPRREEEKLTHEAYHVDYAENRAYQK